MRRGIFDSARPFDVRRWPGYYGWVILVFGTLGMVAAVPGSPPGMSVFVDDMLDALGMERSRFALAYTCGTITAGLTAPFAGGLIDRLGCRLMGCVSFFSLGLVLVYTGSLGAIRGLFGTGGGAVVPFVLVFLAFAGIRLTGVGLGMTACRSMVFRWFEGRRGWAAAINGVVLSLSFSSAPVLLNGAVVSVGWQTAWIGMGLVFAVGMTGLAYLFFRDSPESCNVAVEQGGRKPAKETRVPVVRDLTGRDAVRTRAFWIFVSGLSLNALIGTGISFHIVAIGAHAGVPRAEAVAIFLPVAIFHIATTLTLGGNCEKFPLKYALCLMVAAQSVALLGVLHLDSGFWRWAYIAGSGIGWGTFGILINVPWPRFYGRRHLGAINGRVTGATVVTSALGPYLFGLSNELTGSFVLAVAGCLAVCPFILLLAAVADNPQQRLHEAAASGIAGEQR